MYLYKITHNVYIFIYTIVIVSVATIVRFSNFYFGSYKITYDKYSKDIAEHQCVAMHTLGTAIVVHCILFSRAGGYEH